MTRTITIHLAALTRVCYDEDIIIQDDLTDEDIDEVVQQKYNEVDGGEYYDDSEYWEKAACYWEENIVNQSKQANIDKP